MTDGDPLAAGRVQFELLESIKLARASRGGEALDHHTKGTRNELIRLYMANGWHDQAADVATHALRQLTIDRTCPNRPAVVAQALGRVLVEAGRIEEGQTRLEESRQLSEAFMALVEQAWHLDAQEAASWLSDAPEGPKPR